MSAMVIDVHTHMFPDALAERALHDLCAQSEHTITPVSRGTMEDLLDQMRASDVNYAVICQIATKPAQFRVLLEYAIMLRDGGFGENAARHLIPFASVHPADEARFTHLQCVAESGIRGIKLHPYYQTCVLDSPEMLEYLRCCRDLNLIVQCHCGFDIGFPFEPLCGPERVARVVAEVPGLRFIAAHLGGWRQWGGAVEHLLGKAVYLDTSILHHDLNNPGALTMLRQHPPEYLMFGTDWPWLSFAEGIEFVAASGLKTPQITAIMGDNAATLLGISRAAPW